MKGKKFNLDAFLWTIILSLYGYMILELVITGDILLFLHPKMLIYVYLAFAFICILILYQVTKWFQIKSSRIVKKGYLIFLVPLILAFTVNPEDISVQMAENKGLYVISNVDKGTEVKDASITNMPAISASSLEVPYYVSDFASTLVDMYLSPENYDGRTIQVTGFLYREDGFEPNTFVVARMLLNCCAADAQVAGIKCEWDQMDTLDFDKWYLIEGKVKLVKQYSELIQGEETLTVISVTKAVEVTEPDNPYIYP